MELEFDRPYIAMFTLQIRINPSLGSRYFSGVNIDNSLSVEVNPAYLSVYGKKEADTLQ